MSITLDIEIPKGYEATGEYRPPNMEEYYLNSSGSLCSTEIFMRTSNENVIILKKIIVKRPMNRREITYVLSTPHIVVCDLCHDMSDWRFATVDEVAAHPSVYVYATINAKGEISDHKNFEVIEE